jgi:hypothetical protein
LGRPRGHEEEDEVKAVEYLGWIWGYIQPHFWGYFRCGLWTLFLIYVWITNEDGYNFPTPWELAKKTKHPIYNWIGYWFGFGQICDAFSVVNLIMQTGDEQFVPYLGKPYKRNKYTIDYSLPEWVVPVFSIGIIAMWMWIIVLPVLAVCLICYGAMWLRIKVFKIKNTPHDYGKLVGDNWCQVWNEDAHGPVPKSMRLAYNKEMELEKIRGRNRKSAHELWRKENPELAANLDSFPDGDKAWND